MLRHVVERQRSATPRNPNPGTEIAREIQVCSSCEFALSYEGMSLSELLAANTYQRFTRRDNARVNSVRRDSAPTPTAPLRVEQPITILNQTVAPTPVRKPGRIVRAGSK